MRRATGLCLAALALASVQACEDDSLYKSGPTLNVPYPDGGPRADAKPDGASEGAGDGQSAGAGAGGGVVAGGGGGGGAGGAPASSDGAADAGDDGPG